jgi:hypothetical protein
MAEGPATLARLGVLLGRWKRVGPTGTAQRVRACRTITGNREALDDESNSKLWIEVTLTKAS